MISPAIGIAIATLVALGISLTALLCARAYHAGILIPSDTPAARPTLILPATGPVPDIETLFAALLGQTLPPGRLIVTVESRDDPAYARIAALAPQYPALAIELVVAGVSDRRAQKCTNLLAAIAQLTPADERLVFLDADIRPQPWWLAALIEPLAAGRADIVNGYRWQMPERVSLAAVLVAAIDRGIATVPRPAQFRLLWGGSVGITRAALDRIDPPETLARAMTEDLVVAARAPALGLRVLTRRGLRVPTPLDASLRQGWRFGRRQYQLVRMYRPGVWHFAAGTVTGDLLARISLIAGAAIATGTARWIAAGGLVALGLSGSAIVEYRRAIGRRLDVGDPARFTLAQHLLVWTFLPAVLFHASIVWAGRFYATVVWGHVRYRVDRQGRVIGASRSAHRPRGDGDGDGDAAVDKAERAD